MQSNPWSCCFVCNWTNISPLQVGLFASHPAYPFTMNSFESIWPPPFSTWIHRNEEPQPARQRDKEISLSPFILYQFEVVGQFLPEIVSRLFICRTGSLHLETYVPKRCNKGVMEGTGCFASSLLAKKNPSKITQNLLQIVFQGRKPIASILRTLW